MASRVSEPLIFCESFATFVTLLPILISSFCTRIDAVTGIVFPKISAEPLTVTISSTFWNTLAFFSSHCTGKEADKTVPSGSTAGLTSGNCGFTPFCVTPE